MRLARGLDLGGYSAPAGGCLLTDPRFALRVRDLMAHEGLHLFEAGLLRVGRHFRLPGGAKLVIGRDQAENVTLASMARVNDTVLVTQECPGPTAVLVGDRAPGEAGLAARLVARYSDGRSLGRVRVKLTSADKQETVDAVPLDPDSVKDLIV
jgi:hypothetical protein